MLRPPAGDASSYYEIHVRREQLDRGASRHYQPKTGAFVAGPFAPGKVFLRVFDNARASQAGEQEITIEAGQVTKVEVCPVAASPAKPDEPEQVLMGAGGIQRRGSGTAVLHGSVKMADGKTPAAGAMVYFFDAGKPGRIRVAAAYQGKDGFDDLLRIETTADANGHFTLSGLTRGICEVQAALDDIWLSETSTVAVGPGPLADVTLAIGPRTAAAASLRSKSDRPSQLRRPAVIWSSCPMA